MNGLWRLGDADKLHDCELADVESSTLDEKFW